MDSNTSTSARRFLACLAGLFTMLPGYAIAEPPAPVAVTLEEAVTRAMEHAPQVIAATGAQRTAAAAKLTAIGAWLPSVSIGAGTSVGGSGFTATDRDFSDDAPLAGAGLRPSLNAGISASWDLFNGGRTLAQQEQAAAQGVAANAQYANQRSIVAFLVERAFSDEERAEALLAVNQARIVRAQQVVDAAERRAAVGSATRSDVLRAQLELNTAREALAQVQSQSHTARYALGRLIGIDGPADARSTTAIVPGPLAISDEELIALLVDDSPTAQSAQAQVRSANAGIGAARAAYMPSLRLSAGYDISTRAAGASAAADGWSVGLGLSFPLFDGFKREESMERARVAQNNAAAELSDLRRELSAGAQRLLSQLRLQEARIGFADQAVKVAQEDLRVQQERYRLGTSTMLDLLSSQTTLVQQENAVVSARFDYQLARAELQAIAGRPL